MSDIFREVDEDLRRDKLVDIWKRFGPALVTGAVLIVVATTGYVLWERYETARATERTEVLIRALEKAQPAAEGQEPDRAAALQALAEAAASLDGDHATLARLHEAGLLVGSGRQTDAVAVYDQIAGSAGTDPLLRDLAALLAAVHSFDTSDPAQLQLRLQPLTAPGNAWRWSALELSGLAAAKAGNTAEAARIFTQLSEDSAAPAGIRARATELAALHAVPK